MNRTYKNHYQARVAAWMAECFGAKIAADKRERSHRFIEESLELVQALGCTRDDVLKLVDYVYNRPVGEIEQEVGGVSVTLAALCSAASVNLVECAERELLRVSSKEMIERIRAKNDTKQRMFATSPLPGIDPGPLPQQYFHGLSNVYRFLAMDENREVHAFTVEPHKSNFAVAPRGFAVNATPGWLSSRGKLVVATDFATEVRWDKSLTRRVL